MGLDTGLNTLTSGIPIKQSSPAPASGRPDRQELLDDLADNHIGVGAELGNRPDGVVFVDIAGEVNTLSPLDVMRQKVEDRIVELLTKEFNNVVIQDGLNNARDPHRYVERLLGAHPNPFNMWNRDTDPTQVDIDIRSNGDVYTGTATHLLGEHPIQTLTDLCTALGENLDELARTALSEKRTYPLGNNPRGGGDKAKIVFHVGEGTDIVVPIEEKYRNGEDGGGLQLEFCVDRATFIAQKDTYDSDGIKVPLYRKVVEEVTMGHYHPNKE